MPPRHLPPNARVWYGREVEGRLKSTRLETAFVTERMTFDEMAEFAKVAPAHLFITEEFTDWEWFARSLLPVHDGPITIGVEATDCERLREIKIATWSHRVRVMLRFWGPATLDLLGRDDEVSVGKPFDLLTFRAGDGVRTVPGEYGDDWSAL